MASTSSRVAQLEVNGPKQPLESQTIEIALEDCPQSHRSRTHWPSRQRWSNDARSKFTQNHPHVRYVVLVYWWLEISACIVFILSIAALVATIAPHAGKPLPNWPYKISVNSLISIYTVILKTTVVFVLSEGVSQLKWDWYRQNRRLRDMVDFDGASRGPTGALSLLWNIRHKNLVASFAAVLIVVMTIVDPFVQQVAQHKECEIIDHGLNATIARTQLPSNSYRAGGSSTVSPILSDTINNGLTSGGIPNFYCPTGNCTFQDPYTTIAYCSVCKDISDALNFTRTGPDHFVRFGVETKISLPSGLSILLTKDFGSVNYGGNDDSIFAKFDGTSGEFIYAMTSPGRPFINPITYKPPANCTNRKHESSWRCRGYGASRCQLDFCIRTYKAEVVKGQLHEIELERTSPTTGAGYGLNLSPDWINYEVVNGVVDYQCLSASEKEIANNGRFNESTRFIPLDLQSQPFYAQHAANINATCLYGIHSTEMDHVSGHQAILMSSEVTFTPKMSPKDKFWPGWFTLDGSQAVQTMFKAGEPTFEHIENIFANVSDALTNWMRNEGHEAFSAPAIGQVTTTHVCLDVHWPWLVMPLTLALSTLVCFTLIVISAHGTRHSADHNPDHQGIWKSSPLAYLFHGVEYAAHWSRTHDTENIRAMERIAEQNFVRLGVSDEGVVKLLVAEGEGESSIGSPRSSGSDSTSTWA